MVRIVYKDTSTGKIETKYFVNKFWGIKFLKKAKHWKNVEIVEKMKVVTKNDINCQNMQR